MLECIDTQLAKLKSDHAHKENGYRRGEAYYRDGHCQVLTYARNGWEVLVLGDEEEEREVKIHLDEEQQLFPAKKGKPVDWDSEGIAALMQIREDLSNAAPKLQSEGKVYTREGMIKRVLEERREKAEKSRYKITFADNIYGEHILINDKGVRYRVTLRDFEQETGYIDNPDLQTNKLGTTKHIMYAFKALKSKRRTYDKLSKKYPFIEIFLDPPARLSHHLVLSP